MVSKRIQKETKLWCIEGMVGGRKETGKQYNWIFIKKNTQTKITPNWTPLWTAHRYGENSHLTTQQ